MIRRSWTCRRQRRRRARGPFDQAWLRTDLDALVESFHLGPEQDHFLRSRWLENVLWMEAAAQRTRTRYYALRLTTVVGAVIVPALVSINAVGGAETAITWLTFAVSLVVAVSAAVEGFFRFGERWRHYRSLVEELKSEGWDFYELSGPYRADGATHATAFPAFVDRVNDVLRRETQAYIAEIASPPQAPAPSDGPGFGQRALKREALRRRAAGPVGKARREGAPFSPGEASPDETADLALEVGVARPEHTVPEQNLPGGAPGRERLALGSERDAVDAVAGVGVGEGSAAGGRGRDVPQQRVPVVAAGRERLAVGSERDAEDACAVDGAGQGRAARGRGRVRDIPQQRLPVAAAHRERLAGERDAIDAVAVGGARRGRGGSRPAWPRPATFHSSVFPFPQPAARVLPSAANATLATLSQSAGWAGSAIVARGVAAAATSHSSVFPLPQPAASVLPSEANATLRTLLQGAGLARGAPGVPAAPTPHSSVCPLAHPAASVFPANATLLTLPQPGLARGAPRAGAGARCHSTGFLSQPAASVLPSAVNATL